ncbi:MAG: hypothetical protein AB7T31_15065 [Gemmatimonadales bacterium]
MAYLEEDLAVDELVGLGFIPLVGAAVATPEGRNIAKSIGSKIVGGAKNLFGGGPENEPSGWETEAITGRVRCAEGGQFMYDYLDPSRRIPGHPGFRKGEYYGVDVDEIEAAINFAPQGRPGDNPGTREGLISALRIPNPSMPRPRTNRELANAAVYVAHGKGDCKIGSQESPAAEHIDGLLQNYRRAQQSILPTPTEFAAAVDSVPTSLPELGEIARRNPLATIGVLAGLVFAASFVGGRR